MTFKGIVSVSNTTDYLLVSLVLALFWFRRFDMRNAKDGRRDRREKAARWRTFLDQARAAGATVKLAGESSAIVRNFNFGNATWAAFSEWAQRETPSSPVVSIHRRALSFVPRDTSDCVLDEATSIMNHYAALRSADFPDGKAPEMGPCREIVAHKERFLDGKMALAAMLERIQNPPESYRALRSLRGGGYICHVVQEWPGLVVLFTLMKPSS